MAFQYVVLSSCVSCTECCCGNRVYWLCATEHGCAGWLSRLAWNCLAASHTKHDENAVHCYWCSVICLSDYLCVCWSRPCALQNGWINRDAVWAVEWTMVAQGSPREGELLGGGHTSACRGLPAVDILNVISKRSATMRPLATVDIATCYC